LTTINEYGEVLPDLARDWIISSDGLEYVIFLREDVLWQDGITFTADDVIYTMSLLTDRDFPGSEALAQFWNTVEVQKIDDYTLRFRLPQPIARFTEALRIGILPVHAFEGTTASQLIDHPFNLSPIGTGPYQLEKLNTFNGQITAVDLRVAPTYRQRPEGQAGYDLERIRFQLFASLDGVIDALEAGEIDAYAGRNHDERDEILSVEGNAPYTAYDPSIGVLIFNWVNDDVAAFRDQRVRLALATGLDRDLIIQQQLVNKAVRADSPILRQSWAYSASVEWPPYNMALANELLSSSSIGRTDDEAESDVLLSFSILTIDDPALVNIAEEIAAQWNQLNVSVSVEAVDLITYSRRLIEGDFDTAIIELDNAGSADPDVYDFWHQGRYPDGQNYGGANDRATSEALERARREANGTNRTIHYRQFQQAFAERAVGIPLYYPLYTYVVDEQVAGVQLGFIGAPPDRFLTIQNWRVE